MPVRCNGRTKLTNMKKIVTAILSIYLCFTYYIVFEVIIYFIYDDYDIHIMS
jgi:hypothetical protein